MPPPTLVLFVGAFALVGLVVAGRGAWGLRPAVHILRNDPTSIRKLDRRDGFVEVEGRAEIDEETVTAPFSDASCLGYEYEVEEYRQSGAGRHGSSGSWETLDAGTVAVPFHVRDDTGRVRIEPEGADLVFEDHTLTVDPGDEPPDAIREYVAETDAVDAQDATLDLVITELALGNRQRFVERRLDPDEHVHVLGTAERTDAAPWGSDLVDATIRDGESPVFLVSDTDERGTVVRLVRRSLGQIAFGAVFVGAALLVLYLTAGP